MIKDSEKEAFDYAEFISLTGFLVINIIVFYIKGD